MANSVNYEVFIKMLTELNDYIKNHYNDKYTLMVRAIGGFSMIVHKQAGIIDSPREKSRDIDSLTEDYPDEIVKEIKRIGFKYGADDPDGWLNNHWNQSKKYSEEFEYFIKWKELEHPIFSNIKIYYADLESMFMFKIRSMDEKIHLAKSNPREQDVIDVYSILKAYNIDNLDNVKNTSIKNTIPYFPFAVNYLIEHNIIQGTKLPITEQLSQSICDSEYGQELMKEAKEYNELSEELDTLCEACDKLSESTKTQEISESEERIQDAEVNNSDKFRNPDVIGSDDGETIGDE